MKKLFNIPNIYTFVAIFYLSLGHFLYGISILTSSVHGLFIAMTLFYFVLSIKECLKNDVMKSLLVLFIIIIIYGSWLALFGTDFSWKFIESPTRYLNKHFMSIAPIFVYYYFSEKKIIDKKWFIYATPFFFFSVYEQHIVEQATSVLRYDYDIGGFQDNSGYFFLAVLPIASFFREKKWIQYFIIIFLTIMIVNSMKRGPIICALIVDFILLYDTFIDRKNKLRNFLLILSLFVGVYLVIEDFYIQNEYFASRIEDTIEGNTSNRDVIYSKIWNCFINQQNILSYVFGNGAYSCARYVGIHAHNDWLEILLSLGVLGFVLYVNYWIALYKLIVKSVSIIDRYIWIALLTIVICNFLKTLFSMSIDDMMLYSSAMFGFCLSQCNKLNINTINKKEYING